MLSKLLIDKTKSQTKTVRLSDGRGMYLEISPTGGKWWRFKYRIDGKEKRISLGVYPDVGLADARDKREHDGCRQGIRNLPFVRKMLRTVQPPVRRLEADASGS